MTLTQTDLSTIDFDFIRDLLHREAAIVLEAGKEYLAENRLQPLVRRHGLAGIGDIVSRIRNGDRALSVEVVDALTTNETSFFRDSHPWDALRDQWLPELVEKRRATKSLNVWFAAASSGQEPYSFAMLLHEHFPEVVRDYTVRLIATDISPSMLERCRSGRYSQLEVNRGLPARLMVEYFERDGLDFVAAPELRDMLELRELNLAQARQWYALPRVDLVFCRNVLIYFDVPTKQAIFSQIHRQLNPDGLLLLGASETTIGLTEDYQLEMQGKTTCYRPK